MISRPNPPWTPIPALVEQISDAGLPVEMEISGDPKPLGPGLELTIYRVVQESLTNSLKYAGPGATAEVSINYENGYLNLAVTDDGRGSRCQFTRNRSRPHRDARARNHPRR